MPAPVLKIKNMRSLTFLFFLGAVSSLYSAAGIKTTHAAPDTELNKVHEPRMKEFAQYYRNGNLKCKTIVIYHNDGSEERVISEAYRKNGTRRYRSVSNNTDLLQYTRYDKQGSMKFERSYSYYPNGILQSVETRKANGDRKLWTDPLPDPPYRNSLQLY